MAQVEANAASVAVENRLLKPLLMKLTQVLNLKSSV